jgi:hypothetical protein
MQIFRTAVYALTDLRSKRVSGVPDGSTHTQRRSTSLVLLELLCAPCATPTTASESTKISAIRFFIALLPGRPLAALLSVRLMHTGAAIRRMDRPPLLHPAVVRPSPYVVLPVSDPP